MAPEPSTRTRLCLGVILVAATVTRLALGFVYFGFHTGDDVEILQAGFLRALGWPYQPWEIRNLLVSDLLVAPAVALASALGVRSTQTLIWLASAPFVLLATINAWLVYRLARLWLRKDGPALLACGLYAFHWLPLAYGSMVYPRTASTTCVLLAALVLWERQSPWWRPWLAGGLVAVAWAIRYSEAIFLLPLLALAWLGERRPRGRALRCASLVAGFAASSLLTVGLEDWLTWGRPFASLVAFARYTLVEGRASSLEPLQPWYWYLWQLPKWLPLTLLPLLWRARKVAGALCVAAFVLLPLLALSAVHHKQLRYLQGILPFLIVLAAAGAWSFWTSGRRPWARALVALSLLLGLSGLSFLGRKSMAAVTAARQLRAAPAPGAVCVSQAWAYGGTLYLGAELQRRELPYPLSAAALERSLEGCLVVALYKADYRRDPAVAALLERSGCTLAGEHRWGRSKPVLVFRRVAESDGSG